MKGHGEGNRKQCRAKIGEAVDEEWVLSDVRAHAGIGQMKKSSWCRAHRADR